ncbi:UPF0409 protein ycdO Flags: Precursor [Erwinia amylovora MR1]|nr:UPF0409 protein ycdO Flags: Precursor [Erwinia amylovora MR1]
MTRQFRRQALNVTMLAVLTSSTAALAADIPQVKVSVNDRQCEPMTLTVAAGKTQFIIKNNSQKGLEWEILKGVMVVEERENIAPGFTQKMTANLEPGEYDMTCGLLSNPKGKLIVKAGDSHQANDGKPDLLQLVGPIANYKLYVTQEVAQLVAATKAFTDAVKAGDVNKAKALYAPTRQHYERIEPIAELFSDLDGAIDAREDDFEKKQKTRPLPASIDWKKCCLQITPLKVWISLPTSCTKTCWICKPVLTSWLSRRVKSWEALPA